MLCRWEKP